MHSDPLSVTALRYAARDLPAVETAAFEVRLATDPSAQDALAEAVRLSAAALGRPEPKPLAGLSGLIADRLNPVASAAAGLFRRRAYRGHPMTWAGLGAMAAAVAVTTGVWLADAPQATCSNNSAACPARPTAPSRTPQATESDMPGPSQVTMTAPDPTQPPTAPDQVPPAAEVPNPMTAAGSTASAGGDIPPPADNHRPDTVLPSKTPGMNPDDTLFPFDPPVKN